MFYQGNWRKDVLWSALVLAIKVNAAGMCSQILFYRSVPYQRLWSEQVIYAGILLLCPFCVQRSPWHVCRRCGAAWYKRWADLISDRQILRVIPFTYMMRTEHRELAIECKPEGQSEIGHFGRGKANSLSSDKAKRSMADEQFVVLHWDEGAAIGTVH